MASMEVPTTTPMVNLSDDPRFLHDDLNSWAAPKRSFFHIVAQNKCLPEVEHSN